MGEASTRNISQGWLKRYSVLLDAAWETKFHTKNEFILLCNRSLLIQHKIHTMAVRWRKTSFLHTKERIFQAECIFPGEYLVGCAFDTSTCFWCFKNIQNSSELTVRSPPPPYTCMWVHHTAWCGKYAYRKHTTSCCLCPESFPIFCGWHWRNFRFQRHIPQG
jgi:hypothetical protein